MTGVTDRESSHLLTKQRERGTLHCLRSHSTPVQKYPRAASFKRLDFELNLYVCTKCQTHLFQYFQIYASLCTEDSFLFRQGWQEEPGLHAATKGFLIQISELFKTQRQRQVIANHNWHLHFGGEWGTYGGKLLK